MLDTTKNKTTLIWVFIYWLYKWLHFQGRSCLWCLHSLHIVLVFSLFKILCILINPFSTGGQENTTFSPLFAATCKKNTGFELLLKVTLNLSWKLVCYHSFALADITKGRQMKSPLSYLLRLLYQMLFSFTNISALFQLEMMWRTSLPVPKAAISTESWRSSLKMVKKQPEQPPWKTQQPEDWHNFVSVLQSSWAWAPPRGPPRSGTRSLTPWCCPCWRTMFPATSSTGWTRPTTRATSGSSWPTLQTSPR